MTCQDTSPYGPFFMHRRLSLAPGPEGRGLAFRTRRSQVAPWGAWFAFVVALLLTPSAFAERVGGVVSERTASRWAQATERLLKEHPEHEVQLRTPTQWEQLDDDQAREFLRKSDVFLLGAVFGDQVNRLEKLVADARAPKTVLALHGDWRLTRLSRLDGRRLFDGLERAQIEEMTVALASEAEWAGQRALLAKKYPRQAPWLEARGYWLAGGADNAEGLLRWLLSPLDGSVRVPTPVVQSALRAFGSRGERSPQFSQGDAVVALLDYDSGDEAGHRAVHQALCDRLEKEQLHCLRLLARWGEASVQALNELPRFVGAGELSGIVVLQDFVVGGGQGRQAATEAMKQLDVPVYKALRLHQRSEAQWRLSEDGLSWDSLHYRLAMPELQGLGQPHVLAVAGPGRHHELTGLVLSVVQPVEEEAARLARRAARFRTLQTKARADRRVAIVYYNHPPGRHNIGADNLDVPASLLSILRRLKAEGYDTGPLPKTAKELLGQLQERGVNLPENRAELGKMAPHVPSLSVARYEKWWRTLPASVQAEMQGGPLVALSTLIDQAVDAQVAELARSRSDRVLNDVRHLLQGAHHPARQRALDLLDQLQDAIEERLDGKGSQQMVVRLSQALAETKIEGIRGWGNPPGRSMVLAGKFVIPGLRFGNVYVGPQPPRGWELDEELLHANLAFPPPHQYLALYHWIRTEHQADVVLHLGRHSTAEFLPGHRAATSGHDYPQLLLGDLPNAYVYIVDGVGEGIQAKRRFAATIVDHLTPALRTTPLYDELLELRQLVESYEATVREQKRSRAVLKIRELVEKLSLRQEIESILAEEEGRDQVSLDEVDDELLVHEVGHYLTEMQEQFMPFGLHVFGQAWVQSAKQQMLESMSDDGREMTPEWRRALDSSPRREMDALLAALDGQFVAPGPGNDPIRSPEVLPTGRNFHALDGSVIPTRLAYELGTELAKKARTQGRSTPEGSEAVVLWASDTVRDEGVMVSFGMDMLGIRPVWNSRGIIKSLQRAPLTEGQVRRDVTFVTSGLFRDLYPNLLVWLDRAVLLALDGSSEVIRDQQPDLVPALEAALAPLGEAQSPGGEALSSNEIASHWIADARAAHAEGSSWKEAGRHAALRLFGNRPGGYGAGVNRLVERSGAWSSRDEIARAYVDRMSHAYGVEKVGEGARDAFARLLARTENTYLGRASNLYGLVDNNDGFDYLGGLNLAVESVRGRTPRARVVQYASDDQAEVTPLSQALLTELRGRHLNPAHLKALMAHGYAGARTMGSEFLENLWGWQVTNPDVIKSWAWDEVHDVYFRDGHDIALDEFLEEDENAPVKTNMAAILLVAAHKGFWETDDARLDELSREFAQLVIEHGLPGSGHTRPNHPMLDDVSARLSGEQRKAFEQVRADAKMPEVDTTAPSTLSEVTLETAELAKDLLSSSSTWLVTTIALLAWAAGAWRGRAGGLSTQTKGSTKS